MSSFTTLLMLVDLILIQIYDIIFELIGSYFEYLGFN